MKLISNLDEAFDGIADLTKALHFETDEQRAEEMKIELGRRQGEVTRTKQIEGGEYALRRFRKEIKYDTTGEDLGVFKPGSYMAATSKLGDGPHKKAVKKVKWNRKKYDQWLEDVASNGGWENAYDMAQNAKHEPGLLQWAKKEFRGEDVMQRIQWDIEAFAESVVTEGKIKYSKGKTYQSSGHWTVYVDSNSSGFDIRVNHSAGWRLDPHDEKEETLELLDNGRQRATIYFKSGNIDKLAQEMFDLNDRTSSGNQTKLTAKDYADIIRVWIDMKMANESSNGSVSLNPGMTTGGIGDPVLPTATTVGSGDMLAVADIDDDEEEAKKEKTKTKLEMEGFQLHTKFTNFIAESAITEAKFVKEFDKAVLDAETEKDVLKVYPKAEFFVGKLSHFFGELEKNLFFKAYYADWYKKDTGKSIKGDFKITSIYSEKGSSYVHLFNELEESVVTEAKAYKLKASEFGADTHSAAYNVKGEPTWRVHSTYAIDQVSGENNPEERDVVFFESMPINNDIYIKIGGINNLKRSNGSTVGENFGTTIEEWKKDPSGIAKEASDFLTDATHLKWINKKARSEGQVIKWALKDDYSSVIEDLVNKSLGLAESVTEDVPVKKSAFAEFCKLNEAKDISRDEMMEWIKKYMKFVGTSEEFNGSEGGIHVSGEAGDEYKGAIIYSYYSEDYKNREFGVWNKWEKELNKRGWYSEWYDAGTVCIWPL